MRASFDEMQAAPGSVREHYAAYDRWLARQPGDVMKSRREEAEVIFRRVGITFAVYGDKDDDGAGTERLIPFDLIPRVIPAHEWSELERGLRQRVTALNRFVQDVYHGQEIVRAGIVPAEQIVAPGERPLEHGAEHRPRAPVAQRADRVDQPDDEGRSLDLGAAALERRRVERERVQHGQERPGAEPRELRADVRRRLAALLVDLRAQAANAPERVVLVGAGRAIGRDRPRERASRGLGDVGRPGGEPVGARGGGREQQRGRDGRLRDPGAHRFVSHQVTLENGAAVSGFVPQ